MKYRIWTDAAPDWDRANDCPRYWPTLRTSAGVFKCGESERTRETAKQAAREMGLAEYRRHHGIAEPRSGLLFQ